jgi:hypothetical protein
MIDRTLVLRPRQPWVPRLQRGSLAHCPPVWCGPPDGRTAATMVWSMPQDDQAAPRPGIRRRASARPVPAPGRWLRRALDARVVAIVLGVLAVLGLLGAALSFVVDLFVAPWRLLTADGEESLHLLASVLGLAGAIQLSRYGARRLVLAGLGLNVLATLAFSLAVLGRLETLVPLLTWLGLAALTLLARPPQP